MRFAIVNLRRFFSVYVPLTAMVGLATGSFQAPGHDRSLSYELFLWFVVAVQVVGPTLLVFLVVLMLLKVTAAYFGATPPLLLKTISVVAVVLALPTTQALSWGAEQLSLDWLAVAVFPAGVLGYLIVLPRPRTSTIS